jgi:hypothetical protein
MDLRRMDGSELRFAGYVEGLASIIGHMDGSARCAIIVPG